MLLNDISKVPDTKFRILNKYLETNYGFKLSENLTREGVNKILEQLEQEILELKIDGNDAKSSPEISKRLLILEGIKYLKEYADSMVFESPDLKRVLEGMTDYVCECFRLSGVGQDDFESALQDAMKHYRSSKYRFPDATVEDRVRQMSMDRLFPGHTNQSMTAVLPMVAETEFVR
jgi:hypothetical protein